MTWLFAAIGLAAMAFVLGTDRLGRPLTDEEKRRADAVLRKHDYPGARLVALRFAYRLARRRGSAEELVSRADFRLVRQGWDPEEVSLVRALCRLVWSEHTHSLGETAAERKMIEAYIAESGAGGAGRAPSADQLAAEREGARLRDARASARLDKLRAHFEQAGDTINLRWLEQTLAGEDDPKKIAEKAGCTVADLYDAADRRKRAVRRILAEASPAGYVKGEE